MIQDKFSILKRENKRERWSDGIKINIWQINIGLHETTDQSHSKVTFGEDLKVELGPFFLLSSVLVEIPLEEDLEEFLESI